MLTLPNIRRSKSMLLISNFLIIFVFFLFVLMFGSKLSYAASATYNATPALNIPDNGCPTYNTITLPVTDNFTLSDVNIGININHTYQSDVRIRLTSPQGTTIFLSDGSGTGNNNFDIMFDDAATSSITTLNATHNTSTPYYENLFRPTNALSAFNGQNAQGNWIVGVCDQASADTGSVSRVQLVLTGSDPYPTDAGAAVCNSAASQGFTPIRHHVSWPHNDPIGTLNPTIWDTKVASAQALVPASGLTYLQAEAFATDYVVKQAATANAQAAWAANDYLTYTFTTANTVESSDFLSVLSYGLYSIRTFGQRITVLLSESASFATATEVLSNYLVSPPTSTGYSVVNVPVDKRVYIKPSTTYYMRVLFHNLPDPVAGAHWDDWSIGFASCADYGDISSSYGAARHKMPANDVLRLGVLAPDAEDSMAVTTDASGDDMNGSDDEDGITLPVLVQGQIAAISATVAGAGGYLQGWIDWNGNGVFDASEQVATNIQDNGVGDTNSVAGTIAFNVNVPANATTTPTYARFRWSSTAGLNSTDVASNGEIEDYRLTITASSCTPLIASDAYSDEFIQWMHNANTPLGAPANNLKAYIRQPIYAASAGDEGFNNLTVAVPNTESHIQTASIPALWDTSRYISYSFTTSAFLGSATLYGVSLGIHGDARPTYDKRSGAYRLKVLVDTDPNFGSPTNFINGIRIDDTQPNLDASTSWSAQDLGSSLYYFNHYQATQVELLAPNTTYYVRVYPYSATRSGYDAVYGSNDVIYDDFTLKLKSCAYDLGDAPASYGSPNHLVTNASYLGANAPDGQDAFTGALDGNNDDTNGIDDEDGISFSVLTRGQIATLSATVTGLGGYLQGWMDWNGDGDFADSDEQIANNIQDNLVGDSDNTIGTIAFSFTVPANAITTPTYARFRWSSTQGLNSTAAANDGEVEDYAITISPSGPPAPPPNLTTGNSRMCGTIGSNKLAGSIRECPDGKVVVGVRHTDRAVGAPNSADGMTVDIDLLCASVNTDGTTASIVVDGAYTDFSGFDQQGAVTTATCPAGTLAQRMGGWDRITTNGWSWTSAIQLGCRPLKVDALGRVQVNTSAPETLVSAGNLESNSTHTLRGLFGGVDAYDIIKGYRPQEGGEGFDGVNVSCASLQNYDYGDAPSALGGPKHLVNEGTLYLGSGTPDAETITLNADVAGGSNGTGDDLNRNDDEDGVMLPVLSQGQSAMITATVTGAGGYLQGWIDWNGNGVFDASEQVATNLQDNGIGDTNTATGTIAFSVSVPTNATTTPTYARFRWSSTSGLDSTTSANNGEVEDYAVTIRAAVNAVIATPDPYALCKTTSVEQLDAFQYATATGSGATGTPSLTYTAPEGSNRMMLVLLSVERDHTPVAGGRGDNYETNIAYTNNVNDAPTVTFGGVALSKQSFYWDAFGLTSTAADAEISRSYYMYSLFDLNIPAGAQTLQVSGINAPKNAGDDAILAVATFANVGAIEVAGGLNDRQSPFSLSIPVSPIASGEQPPGTTASDNLILGYGSSSTPEALSIGAGWTKLAELPVNNNAGSYVSDPSRAQSVFTENDGHTLLIQSIQGVSSSQTAQLSSASNISGLGLNLFRFVAHGCDYGDAPASYGEAVHSQSWSRRLGAQRGDAETGMLTTANAEGDDTTVLDDEDGVTFANLVAGQVSTISVNVAGSAYLSAWIDWNGNGVFDASEKIANDLADNGAGDSDSAIGVIKLSVNVPLNAVTTPTYARFRWSMNTGIDATGFGSYGEVEDYTLTIQGSCSTVVTTVNDSGVGSLREAINCANSDPLKDLISFNISGAGVKTINVLSPLPALTDTGITIDGTTQVGASCGSVKNASGAITDRQLLISLNGTNAGSTTHGLVINNAANVTIKGLSIGNFARDALRADNASNTNVLCNHIGLAADGVTATPNLRHGIVVNGITNGLIGDGTLAGMNIIGANEADGVRLEGTTDNVIIDRNYIGIALDGNTSRGNGRGYAGAGISFAWASSGPVTSPIQSDGEMIRNNVIAGNGSEIVSYTNGVLNLQIESNYIGTDATGLLDRSDQWYGIDADLGAGWVIRNNVISAMNGGSGIELLGFGSTTIQGNLIGVGSDGVTPLGNEQWGIRLEGGGPHLVGGIGAGEGNIIAYNAAGYSGVLVQDNGRADIRSNTIHSNYDDGVSVTSTARVVIAANQIYNNAGLGIDLGVNGVNQNDPSDADTGANDLLNYPVLNQITANNTSTFAYSFNLDVPANVNGYRVEFFKNSSTDPSGYGEGEFYLGYVDISHTGGNLSFTGNFTGNAVLAVGDFVSSTATAKTASGLDVTSEFSASIMASAINVAPIITSNGGGDTASLSLTELTTLVTTVTATDADNDVLTYSINGGADAARFAIDPNTGVLSFITAPDFEAPSDADANNTYLVQVAASDGKGGVDTQMITITITNIGEGVSLSVRGLLQGPYDVSTQLMLDQLRLMNLLPNNQPYSSYPSFNYSGNETVSSARLGVAGFSAVVDWVLVELRSATNPSITVARKAALLTREGVVVDAATDSEQLFIESVIEGNYYVVLRHRNHLAVMTQNPIVLATTTNTLVDFRLSTTPTYGVHAQIINSGNRALMRAGNANLDNSIIANGPNNDATVVLMTVLMAEGNETLNANYMYRGYLNADINMDGYTIFAGPNNELNFLIGNIIFHPANSTASENYVVLGNVP